MNHSDAVRAIIIAVVDATVFDDSERSWSTNQETNASNCSIHYKQRSKYDVIGFSGNSGCDRIFHVENRFKIKYCNIDLVFEDAR